MSDQHKDSRSKAQLLAEIERLQFRLQEAEETLEAIRSADVDALVVAGPQGEQVFSITGAEHIYRVIVETMNEAALTVDPDGTILFCNQRFCDLMKAPIQGVMGRKATVFAARPQQVPLKTFLAEAQGGSVQRRLTLRAADGAEVPVQLSASPLEVGGSASICVVATDLTELEASANSLRVLREHQQALEESEARFRTMFEASHDAIVITDDAGIYVQANPAAQTVFGLPPEQLLGHRVSEFLDVSLDFPTFWRNFLTAGSFHGDLIVIDAQSQQREVDIYTVTNIQPGRHMAVIRDITERKRAQRALEDMNERLQEQTEELEEQAEELRVQTEELGAANTALRDSERRYRELVQNANSAIIRWDRNGIVTFFNEYAQSFFGYHEKEALGRHVSFLLPERDSTGADLTQLLRNIAEHPEQYASHLNENVCRDGRRVWLTWTNKPIRDAQGQLVEILAVGTDVTDRVRAEQELRHQRELLETVLNTVRVGVLFCDTDGNFTYANPDISRILGQPLNGKVGSPLPNTYQLLKSDRTPMVVDEMPLALAIRTGANTDGTEILIRRQDGRELTMLVNAAPVRDWQGRVTGAVASMIDITDRKRAEEALRELNTTLENKVSQRTAQLQHRARQLQKLTLELSETEDRERRQLAEILHDDLQQQLAAAKFHLSLLNNRAKYDPAQQAIVAQVDQILMEAIQKSRSLSHELSPAVLYHGDFLGALSWLAGQVQTKHGLEVAVDAFGAVNIESEPLKSFLYKAAQEMLFNVVKHARTNKARIRVRRLGRCVSLSVSDRGRGFDPQEVRQTAGFGLFSIHERVELLGGRMKMHSIKGKGSTFHVVVPDGSEDGGLTTEDRRQKAESGLPSAVRPPSSGPRLRVLLADDHEIVRAGLISLLADERDIEVVGEAANGREAVNQAYRLQPDVVVMDVAMPLINGDDATRQIKLHLPKTRVIALSMYEEPDMVEKMRRAGAEDYILKTAPSEVLVAAIRGKRPQPVSA